MAAPAVAVLGVLAAAPQVFDVGADAPAAAASHLRAVHPVRPGQVANMPAGLPELVKDGPYQPRPITMVSAPRPPRAVHRHAHRRRIIAASARRAADHHNSTPPAARPATLTCSGTGGMLPANYGAIVGFLTAHGYTGLAAAGIAGNIYQESEGNPESVGSGGGGLIGWTPLPAGFVTGNPSADLQTQLEALLTFNQQWSQYIPALNAATSATQAADIYMDDFEHPGIPAAGNREASADAVAAACGL
jgi:hypothetical protein